MVDEIFCKLCGDDSNIGSMLEGVGDCVGVIDRKDELDSSALGRSELRVQHDLEALRASTGDKPLELLFG